MKKKEKKMTFFSQFLNNIPEELKWFQLIINNIINNDEHLRMFDNPIDISVNLLPFDDLKLWKINIGIIVAQLKKFYKINKNDRNPQKIWDNIISIQTEGTTFMGFLKEYYLRLLKYLPLVQKSSKYFTNLSNNLKKR